MSASPPSDVYLLARNDLEFDRLNSQHRFFVDLMGSSLIHPSIPSKNFTAIADVAAGTGIWLLEVAESQTIKTKSKFGKCSDKKNYYHGFDVSNAHFPCVGVGTGSVDQRALTVHDIRTRFPPEHRERYDLVHLRLLSAALKEEEYATVMRNVIELIKPNGYLQWEDCDDTAFTIASAPPEPYGITNYNQASRRIQASRQNLLRFMRQAIIRATQDLGLSADAPTLIENLAKQNGLLKVTRHRYSSVACGEIMHAPARKWLVDVLKRLLLRAMVATRAASKENDEITLLRVDKFVRELEKLLEDGGSMGPAVPMVNLQVIVGRKPEKTENAKRGSLL